MTNFSLPIKNGFYRVTFFEKKNPRWLNEAIYNCSNLESFSSKSASALPSYEALASTPFSCLPFVTNMLCFFKCRCLHRVMDADEEKENS